MAAKNLVTSHRFSTVRMADRILVLKGGEQVDQGTHEALVALGGLIRGAVPAAGGGIPIDQFVVMPPA